MKDKASGTDSKCIICGNLYEGYGHNPARDRWLVL